MPKIATRTNKVGNFLKFEADRQEALARALGKVTYAKADTKDMEVGEVLILDAGVYREIVAGDIAGIATAKLAILLDDRIDEMLIADKALAVPTGSTPTDTALLVGGFSPCIVRKGGLNFGAVSATPASVTAVIAQLKTQAITVEAVFSSKY